MLTVQRPPNTPAPTRFQNLVKVVVINLSFREKMGKNPNAKREKVEHRGKERSYGTDVSALEEEASKLGCEVWEIDEFKKKNGID